MSNTMTDSQMHQAWWDGMTDEQREAYEDAQERRNAERAVYGRELTDTERETILSHG